MPDFDWSKASEPAQPEQAAPAFDWANAAEPAQREISKGASAAAGAAKGFGFGLADEVVGARNALASMAGRVLGNSPLGSTAAAVLPFILSPGDATDAALKAVRSGASGEGPSLENLRTDYRQSRDEVRDQMKRAEAAHPAQFLGGEIAGAIATPVPFGKAKAAKNAGRLLKLARAAQEGAALGGAYGLGSSDADLTRGEFGRAAVDTLEGAITGGVGGATVEGVAQGAGKVLKKAGARAQRGIEEATADELAAQALKKAKGVRSATGALGGESAAGIKTLERLEQAAADESLPAEVRKAAADHLASPEMRALKERALRNYVEKAPGQLGKINAAEEALAEANGVDIQKATEEAMANPMKRHVLPRAMTLGHRFLPVAATMIGGAIDPFLGAAAGGIMALAQGRPGIVIRNLARNPSVRRAFWEKVLTASGGSAAVEGAIPALERAAGKGEKAFASVLTVAVQAHPELRDAILKVAGADPSSRDQLAANY